MSQHPLPDQNSNTGINDKASATGSGNIDETAGQLLRDATLYAMKLNGVQASAESLLHALPPSDRNCLQGMARAVNEDGRLLGHCAIVRDLSVEHLPCVVRLIEGGADWGVIESYDEQSCRYQFRCFKEGAQTVVKALAKSDLNKIDGGQVLVLSAKVNRLENQDSTRSSGFSAWMRRELRGLRSVYRDIVMATLLINLFAIAGPLFVMNVYDRVVPNLAMETLWVLASGLVLVIIFELSIKLLRQIFLEQAGKRLDLVLSSKLFSKVLNIRMEAFPPSVGSLSNQVKEFDSIKQFFTAATMTTLADVPFAVIFLLVIAFVGGPIVFVPLIIALVMIVYGFVMHFPIKRLVDEMQEAAAEKNGVLVESIHGVETIKSLNAQGRQQGLWENALVRLSHYGEKAKHLTDSVGIVSSALIQLSTMLVVIVGVYQIEQQALSLGALIACVLLSSRALAPMVKIANLVSQYQQAKTAFNGVNALTALPMENEAAGNRLNFGGEISSLELRELSFSYSGGMKALKDLSFTIEKGEKVAIIGKIGSGKSSLLRLIQGFGQAESGQLLINGYDIRHLDLSELRASIAYVPQEINLFKGSLRENIVMKLPDVSQEELFKVIEVAGLKDLVQNHEMGLDMPIGEQGKGLSGGQRQCVAIARALVNQPDILVFDELSSSMDNQTEQMIINNIRAFSTDRILLLSTHRASLLTLVDRIIVMDQGRVVADGPKNTVLDAMKRGLIQTGSQSPNIADRKHNEGESGV